MPENVSQFRKRVGTREILDLLDAGVAEDKMMWSFVVVLGAAIWGLICLPRKPFLWVTISDFESEDSKSCLTTSQQLRAFW